MGRRVVMVGSDFAVRGGVSAMATVCAEHGLFARTGALYLASHCDGPAARKLARAGAALARFALLLASGRVSLLHVHLNSGASFWRKAAFVRLARAFGVPFVLHVHCGRFGRFVREGAGPRGRALALGLLREAAAVVALSPQGAEELRSLVPGLAVEVIPNPVAPAGPAVPAATPRVLFLGMVTEGKGALDLVRAWAKVAPRQAGELVMAGAGEIDRARSLARELGVEARVSFPGWVQGAAKDALLAGASVFALPSHAEALPMSVLEAMARGVAVVASPVGGVPWMLDDGRAGTLVAPGDVEGLASALASMLADAPRRSALAAAGRRRVESLFAADAVVPRIEALWQRLGAGPVGRPSGAADGRGRRLGLSD